MKVDPTKRSTVRDRNQVVINGRIIGRRGAGRLARDDGTRINQLVRGKDGPPQLVNSREREKRIRIQLNPVAALRLPAIRRHWHGQVVDRARPTPVPFRKPILSSCVPSEIRPK